MNTFRLSDFDETAIADDNFNGDETKNGDGAHCLNGDRRYEHGEKVNQIYSEHLDAQSTHGIFISAL